MTDRCGECERSAIAVSTAKLEREHDAMVIDDLKRKLAEAERRLRELEKKKR